MRHAMRMFLVPEDVFQSVFVQPQAAAADGADGTPIGLLRSRIQQIERNRELNEEQKAAQYHQEFKRLNKLVREQGEQPINVRLQNEPNRKKSPTPPPPSTIDHSTPKTLKKKTVPPLKRQRQHYTQKAGASSNRRSAQKQQQRKAAAAASNSSGNGEAEKEEGEGDDGEQWDDAQSSSSAASTVSAAKRVLRARVGGGGGKETSEQTKHNYQMTKNALITHIRKKGNGLGVSDQGKILRADGSEFKTSSVEAIVIHLLNRDKRSEFKGAPVGYKEFAEKAREDPLLKKYLFPEQALQRRAKCLQVQTHTMVVDRKKEQLLDQLYKDVNSSVSFTSVEPLLRDAKKVNNQMRRKDVVDYLATQRTYTIHRQAKRRYKQLPTLASGLHTEWQADLSVFDKLSRENHSYKYLLVCIDTLSRQLFVEPVKSKKSADMIAAFERLFKRSKYIPWTLLTDQGLEFKAKEVQEYFKSKNVKNFFMYTSPRIHAGMAERANRTIKERLYRYFTERGTQKWVDVIQQIVHGINHSYNSSIKMRPVDVNFENAEKLRKKLKQNAIGGTAAVAKRKQPPPPRFQVGDRVRIEKYKHVFQKGYTGRFTNEVFTVAEVHTDRLPVTYRIRDDDDSLIKGRFYANDLCRVLENKNDDDADDDALYDIEKVVRKRKKQGIEYVLVKWKGYSQRYNRNRTNSFRVRLPRKLQFNSEWDVGLGVIIYPHSWPSLGTSEDQFVQIEWKIGENVQIPIPSSNVTNPIELWKSLYKLLEEGNKPLANKVEGIQKKFTEAANTARQLGRAEYIKNQQQQRDKRNVNDDDDDDDDDDKNEEQLLNALLAGVDTLLDLYGATSGGLLEREKRAATSKVPLKNWDDTDEEYQKKLDKYFLRLRGRNLERLEGLITEKLNAEIALMDDEERTILDQTKELGMTAWIKIFQSAYSACLLHFDNTSNRFSLKLDDRYVQKIKISDQLAYILGFNSTEFTKKETIAKFMPDMSGGVASFHVYAPDLIEPMMIGDVIAPVLRIVTIRGKPDEIIEEQFLSAQYHRVLVKEINQIPAGATTPVPYSIVINVDPTDSPGSHWVAVYCEQPNRVEYYDSTGIWPPFTNYRSKHHTHTRVESM
ncbi:hypothetical protein niasHT_027677 [Heterodera trifolii]|uniref:Integrase catalytic domain-containing protein n=1 Tax=Heterodera trifolii TaxID=157864 RepID=A0ABD2K9W4_9BILA